MEHHCTRRDLKELRNTVVHQVVLWKGSVWSVMKRDSKKDGALEGGSMEEHVTGTGSHYQSWKLLQ